VSLAPRQQGPARIIEASAKPATKRFPTEGDDQ
jgi:hypothetical protein